ncbi:hypothetical protein CC2G_007899 [Coprinopsis cinerea AmutBmut pab1-1]|nr:hypothetical protein CC2G_007899 [Coprinopsis cinerea AmutBmut pab1-1]
MFFKLSSPLTLVLAALSTTLIVPSHAQIPAGTTALAEWFTNLIPSVIPNTTTNWIPPFEDGTFAEDIVVHFNGRVIEGRENMKTYWTGLSANIVARVDAYVIEPTQTVAFTTDVEGREGWVVATGKTWLQTKQGEVYTDGGASAWVVVKWDQVLEKRVVKEWREVNTPPNFPNYPWS